MKPFLLAVVFVCLLGTPLAANDAANPVVVRESLEPDTGAVIGQHVALRVDVLFRGEMPHPPRVSLPDVAGLQILRFETQATSLRETVSGDTYFGQRFEYALYGRRGGTFEIPPAAITLLDRQGAPIGTATGQPLSLAVTVPPGVDASGPVVATRGLTLDEQWAPNPRAVFKPGDAIVRTITRTADDVPGLAMRDLAFPAPEGVRAYVDTPQIEDRGDRGVVIGRRVDRVTYIFERVGPVRLPSSAQPWWDLASRTLKTATAAGVQIEVAAASPERASTLASFMTWLPLTGGGVVLLGVLVIVRRFLLRERWSGRGAVEREAFAALRRACAGADAPAIYRAFSRWRTLLDPVRSARAGDAAAALAAALFGGTVHAWSAGDSRDLLTRLAILRRPVVVAARLRPLPPLNP